MKSKSANKTLVGKIFFVYVTTLLILSFPIQAKAYSFVWTPERIEQTIALGETLDLTVTFRSSIDLKDAELWITPELQLFMSLTPTKFKTIKANISKEVALHLFVPPDSQPGMSYDGAVHLKVGSATNPAVLKVRLNVVYPENQPPVANAGQDQDVTVASLVTLDGRNSYDPDGDLITYQWAIVMAPPGSIASLNNPTSVMPTFTPDLPGEYKISLVVNDGQADSIPDEVLIIASMPNVAPTAYAGPDQSVGTGSTVFLDGRGSFDPDGDPLTYQWLILSSPEGSTASLDYPSSATPTFMADKVGKYTISLTVNDGELDSLPDDVIVISAIPNAPPVSYAGDDQTVSKSTTIQLNGRGSSDPNNDPLTYSWTIVSRPPESTSELNDPVSSTPQILADKVGDYVFRLIVFDGQLYSNSDTVVVTVVNDTPIAEAGPDQDGVVGNPINLNGSGSSDLNGDILTYLWTIFSAPTGNSALLVNPTSLAPIITPNVPGVYVIQLVVNDGSTDSSPDKVNLTVQAIVPDVVGQPQASAESAIIAAGLTVGAITQDNSGVVPVGCVILQNPAAGTLALADSPVSFTVSRGPVTVLVPNVVGLPQADAQSEITAAGLARGTITQANSNTIPTGYVISQNPVAGTSVAQGSSVDLVISIGPLMVIVPNVVGMTQADAGSALTAAGLTAGTITTADSDTVPPGNVISQNPAAGVSVVSGSAVDLVVSLGPSGFPPDPATVAPPLDLTVATTVSAATSFLYSGSNPIQTGVAPGRIDPKRVAVLRGKVLDRDNIPLSGVNISILNYPEYGQTLTRADGIFDLVVNGGGFLTVNYKKEGYLSAQRQLSVPWRDYAWLPDVVLIPLDNSVTSIDLNSTLPFQVARGNVVTDGHGTRQATLLVPQGTQAEMTMPDDTLQPLTVLNIRATEYTVGPNGPSAMPAELPPSSGYTYALELSADEALAAGALKVQFNQSVFLYVENFVGFPVGGIVPVGYYDRLKAQWIASQNGRVVQVVASGSTIGIDADGDGAADSATALEALGFRSTEIDKLSEFYSPGTSLWRIPVTHLTPYDENWPKKEEEGAEDPDEPEPETEEKDPEDCFGSVIECRSQILGESIPIVGTPFSLNYRSDRVKGRKGGYAMKISLSGPSVPAVLNRIDLKVIIAGRLFEQSFPPLAGQTADFVWDGMDAYGRRLQGRQFATVRVGYVYDAFYAVPLEGMDAAFALFGSGTSFQCPSGTCLIPARDTITRWQVWNVPLGGWDAKELGLGGWTLTVHHWYDYMAGELYLGDGSRRTNSISPLVGRHVAGTNSVGFSGDGGPAREALFNSPKEVAVGPDGSVYIEDLFNYRIRKIDPNGIITTVVGNGSEGFSGDGGPATEAQISYNIGLAVGPDGTIWIADTGNKRIRKVGPDGIINTVVGNGVASSLPCYNGDISTYPGPSQCPAETFKVYNPSAIAVAPDGSVYFNTAYTGALYRLETNGLATYVIKQKESSAPLGDGGPASEARIGVLSSIAAGPDGSIYLGDERNNRIRKIWPNGIITTIAGTGSKLGNACFPFPNCYSGDGGPAVLAEINKPQSLALGRDGSLFFADWGNAVIRKVNSNGVIQTIAGVAGSYSSSLTLPVDGTPALQFPMNPFGLALTPNSAALVTTSNQLVQMEQTMPRFSPELELIPSENGEQVYLFDSSGRHLSTVGALTGTTLYQFAYDPQGLLIGISDPNGNQTIVERDLTGNPTAIVGPFGRRTELSLDSNGYLSGVTNPAGEAAQFTYSSDGLLQTLTDPRGNIYRFTYATDGRAIREEDPSGDSKTFTKIDLPNGYEVTKTTALGRTFVYRYERLPTGDIKKSSKGGCCGEITEIIGADGNRRLIYPDGTISISTVKPDPRWGMMSPITSRTVTTPSGLTYIWDRSVETVLLVPDNPLTLLSRTETITANGRIGTRSFDAAGNQIVSSTPEGRQKKDVLDSKGRVLERSILGLTPFQFTYNAAGRLARVKQGSREHSMQYDAFGDLSTIVNPLSQSTMFRYDSGGRVQEINDGGGQNTSYTYDLNGNINSLTPPGRPPHRFNYNEVNLIEDYVPPDVGMGTTSTHYSYNLDKDFEQIVRPDGNLMTFEYDPTGLLSRLIIPRGTTTLAHDPVTGKLMSILTPEGDQMDFSFDGFLLTGVRWSGSVAGSLTHTYNNDFLVQSQKVNEGFEIAHLYDQDGFLVQVGDLFIQRHPQTGSITGTTLGGLQTSEVRNTFGEVTSYEASIDGSLVFSSSYTRDLAGRIIQKTETVLGTTVTYDYTYDSSGRLTEVKENGTTVSTYGYDSNGNRITRDGVGGLIQGSYDDQDRLLTYGMLSYDYGLNGELLTRLDGSNSETTGFVYDALGNLNSVILPGETRIDYIIDGQNHRLGKKVNGVLVTSYLHKSGRKPIAELNGVGEVISRFVYGSKPHVPDYMQRDGKTYRIISDIIGSPRIVIDVSTGTVDQMLEYDEFGNIRIDTNPGFQPFGFAGGLYDPQTKLTRFGTRDYDAQTGRFTSKDLKGISGGNTNLYAYVKNDPINYVDIFGFSSALSTVLDAINQRIQLQRQYDALGDSPLIDPISPGDIIDDYINELEEAAQKNPACAVMVQKLLDLAGSNMKLSFPDIFHEIADECSGCVGKAFWTCFAIRWVEIEEEGRKDCPELFSNP